MKNSAEVVIIGAGISGCSIAYNLAKKGVKNIVVIEKIIYAAVQQVDAVLVLECSGELK